MKGIPEALQFALDHGWPVFPCSVNGKRPATAHGVHDATTDLDQIAEWADNRPRCNWAAAMGGGTVAIDVDVKDGARGRESLKALESDHGALPLTLTGVTPSGGHHLLLKHDPVLSFGNTASKLGPGIDVRSENGYILIPPSVIGGSGYQWRDPVLPVALAPSWLLDALERKSNTKSSAGKIAAGQRNDTLYRYACALRAKGFDWEQAWQALELRNLDCDEPLNSDELQSVLKSAWTKPPGHPCTDLGNAERLVAQHGDDLRYLTGAGWHRWEGHRFVADRRRRIVVMMGNVARGIYTEATTSEDPQRRRLLAKWAGNSESRSRIEAAIALAESRPEIVDDFENYDVNPWLVGLRNGVYDLKADQFRPGVRADRLTLSMNVDFDESARAPRWEAFQLEIHGRNSELVAFKQRAYGYSLSGDTSEQKLFVQYGTGANGKSTEHQVLLEIFGGYGRKVEPDTLMIHGRAGSTANNDVARLRGARLVATAESEDGQRLAESLVKTLTGGDRIAARFLYKEPFEFTMVGKIWLATNHRPEIAGTEHAIWRRIVLIPYDCRFDGAKCDPHLAEKLLLEGPGILNWLIDGYRQWRRQGLALPEEVQTAGKMYRAEMDRVGGFVDECCAIGALGKTKAADVYKRYQSWCSANGIRFLSARKFHERMARDHGQTRIKTDTDWYPSLLLKAWEYDDDAL